MVPSSMLGTNSETIVNLLVGFIGFFLLLIPVLDRKARLEQSSLGFTVLGIVAITYILVATLLAYLT